ncbi:MAG TPA: acyl-CoA synthetase [Stellaceae bacterium]|nr:acyl-CoA synthetase [Stellaceae bacterium]
MIAETADADLLARPLRSVADIEAIERTPLNDRLTIVDFSQRVALGLAAHPPDDTAIFFVPDGDVERPAELVSFRDLRQAIDRTANLLRCHSIGPTDVVAILLPAVPAQYWAILGAMNAGIVFPLNWMLEPAHVRRLLTEAKATAVIALGPTPGFKIWESLTAIADDLPPGTRIWSVAGPGGTVLPHSDLALEIARQPDAREPRQARRGEDVGAYVHSGGTTGLPKIVKLSHGAMSYRHWSSQLAMQLTCGEIIIQDTPMFHVGGLVGRYLPPLACGASILIPSIMGARDKRYMANYWRFVERYRVTRLTGVPTTLAVLAKSPPVGIDLPSLKPNFVTGSTALPAAVRQEFERISGVRVLNSYGMTENTASIAIDPRDGPRKDGASGLRLSYTQIRAAALNEPDSRLRLCGPHEIGMLQIKGPGLAAGYVDPGHEAGARTADGWLITGDLGRVDEDGYVFVTGRAKDVIIRGGHNIDPALIEEPLLCLPDVLHAAAVGKPDGYAGEVPIVYVQLVPGAGATAADLLATLDGRLAERAAMPKEIVILDKLPLTDVGKPIKAALRADAAARAFRTVIAEAIGRSPEVVMRPDSTEGQIVEIAISHMAPADREGIASRIAAAMSRYAFVYRIEWS